MKPSRKLVLFAAMMFVLVLGMNPSHVFAATSVFVNELHYDNAGSDVGEGVEIAGPAGADLSGWSVVFYNGNGGAPYITLDLSGMIPDQEGGLGTLDFPQVGIQNGSPDGFALVDSADSVIQFLSYEGTFTAVGGPADGLTSTDIGVSQSSSTPAGDSLQLTGTGDTYEAFSWAPSSPNTFGNVNAAQTFFSGGNAPIVPACGGPLTIIEGVGGSRGVSASDEDGIVTSATLVGDGLPSDGVTLEDVLPATEVGGTLQATVVFTGPFSVDSFVVTVDFANNGAVPQTANCSFDVSVLQTIPIYEIQGDGVRSPYAGEVVNTVGLVTAVTSNGRDMWIQDRMGDGNPATSDGILVDDRDRLPDPKPVVGDFVSIAAEVQDQQFGVQLPRTILNDPDRYPFAIISGGNPLPAPVTLNALPDFSVEASIEFWSSLEGMRVSVENAPVVAATTRFSEFAMLAKGNAKPGSGFFPQTQQIFVTDLGNEVVDYNPERILVDDATLPPLLVRPGDRVRGLVGVVDYTFGNYKLQPTSYDAETHNLPSLPASKRSGGFGNTAITTYNVENLFDLELNTPIVVDAFGRVGEDPGSGWGPPSTQNDTLVRKPDVCSGRTDQFAPFDPSIEWDGIGDDNFSDLGKHTSNCNPAAGLFISEYIEGSSFNKGLEIYNGTGAPVNLGPSGVVVDVYFNGGNSPGQSISLSGTLADGDVYVLANPQADQAILDAADQLSGGVLWNGDDAIVLRQGGKDDTGSTPEPGELETQLTKLVLAIDVELELPEIIVVQEIENQAIAQVLADRVNGATGTAYVATSFETSDGRGIEPGFLWDASRVTQLEAFQINDDIVPGVSAAFGPESASPGREPIVGVFDIEGNVVTIVGNHFKSKGGDDPIFGINQPFTRVTETQRKLQAQVVRDFVNQIFAENPDAMVMVAGDLNDFAFSEPSEGPDNPIAILEGNESEVLLYNLIEEEKEAERFTFVFDGNSQVLDHMLVSPTLLEIFVAADVLHFDAGFHADLGSDPATTLRASDHDPLEGRFVFEGANNGHVEDAGQESQMQERVYLPAVMNGTSTTVVDTLAADGRFQTLIAVLDAANLVGTLEAEGPFTVFAPVDAAFAALPEGALDKLIAQLDTNPRGQLLQILLYHVSPGELLSADFEIGLEVQTMQGNTASFLLDGDGNLTLNGAAIADKDILADNGVIHAIEAVILPPTE